MTRMRSTGRLGQDVALALILFLLVAALSVIPVVRESEIRLSDTFFRVAPLPRERSQVVVVLIDDEAIRQYGRWPWSRTLLADLTNTLSRSQAAVIGLDILLSEPQSPDADRALKKALQESGRAVLVGKIGSYPDGARWIEPLPQFAESAAAVGHAQAVLDSDAICRRFPPTELTVYGPRWAFAVEVARQTDAQATNRFLGAYDVSIPDGTASITIAKPILVPIFYRRDHFLTLSAATVLRGTDLSVVHSRPVLVGFGPAEIGDRLTTPLSTEYPTPGIEVHAQIVDNILTGRILHDSPLWPSAVLLLLTSGVVVFTFRRWRGWAGVGLLIGIVALLYISSVVIFVLTARVIAVGSLMLAGIIGPLVVYMTDFVQVERSLSRQLRGLRSWLASHSLSATTHDSRDLSWKLELLQNLQTELGALYELHKALLDSSHDLIAIFNQNGRHLLSNRYLTAACTDSAEGLTLEQFTAQLTPKEDNDLLSGRWLQEKEVYLNNELYAMRTVPLPPTTLSPGGGTIVRLSSLRTREERDRARAEALSFITHELRTPLTSIQGFAELMIRFPNVPSAATAPETIFRESRRLVALINSYLDVMRLDAGAKPLSLQELEVDRVVRDVFEILGPIAKAAGVKLALETCKEPLIVIGDPPLISGAVLNLVSNAIKYGKPHTDVVVECLRVERETLIRVTNQGEPISQEEIPHLFDSYYRGSEVQSAKDGWGLGLAFVRRIAEKHGGLINVVSQESGVTFELRLPARMVAAAAAERKR